MSAGLAPLGSLTRYILSLGHEQHLVCQRTPWGGWKTSRMTHLPKRAFGPPRTVRFPPPLGVSARTAKSTHHPHKIDDQHRKCKTGGGAYFAFFLGSDNSHTTPPKIPLDEEGLCGVRGWRSPTVLCFSCTKIHDRADQKLFWEGGPKFFGRARSLVRFPPPIRFATPHITAQVWPLIREARISIKSFVCKIAVAPQPRNTLIPLSVLFSFPVLFWCRFYPRFFLSVKGIWGLKKAQF